MYLNTFSCIYHVGGCKDLVKSSPDKAVANADSIWYC